MVIAGVDRQRSCSPPGPAGDPQCRPVPVWKKKLISVGAAPISRAARPETSTVRRPDEGLVVVLRVRAEGPGRGADERGRPARRPAPSRRGRWSVAGASRPRGAASGPGSSVTSASRADQDRGRSCGAPSRPPGAVTGPPTMVQSLPLDFRRRLSDSFSVPLRATFPWPPSRRRSAPGALSSIPGAALPHWGRDRG